MTSSTLRASLATLLAVAVGAAVAQTSAATDTAPATVGVSQPKAASAMNKAVPRSDTATLVRTDKSVGARGAANVDAGTMPSDTEPSAAGSGAGSTRTRGARAARN